MRRDPVRMSAVTPRPDVSGTLLPSTCIARRSSRMRAMYVAPSLASGTASRLTAPNRACRSSRDDAAR